VDATLAWTVVGSCAGVAGVAIAALPVLKRARPGQQSKVAAELAAGQLTTDGVLYVEFASGKTGVLTLPEVSHDRTGTSREQKEKGVTRTGPCMVLYYLAQITFGRIAPRQGTERCALSTAGIRRGSAAGCRLASYPIS
jgi:hypothetical protein